MNCPNCASTVRPGLTPWHYECPTCQLEMSTLQPAPDLADMDADVDEAARARGLADIRHANFKTVIRVIDDAHPPGNRLLDVGCAHGWFLDAARPRFDVTGIEPSERVAEGAKRRGHEVRNGLFPSALTAGETFDVITFNDVFEHIPNASDTMQHAAQSLNPDGLLVLNVPTRRGFFYKLSRGFTHVGVIGPFERLWQKHFSSPHLYYFDADVLGTMGKNHGLTLVRRKSLHTLHLKGLWQRLNYDRSSSRSVNALLFAMIVAAYPVIRLLPSDIDLLVFRK